MRSWSRTCKKAFGVPSPEAFRSDDPWCRIRGLVHGRLSARDLAADRMDVLSGDRGTGPRWALHRRLAPA